MPKLYLVSSEPTSVCLFYYDDTIDVLVEYGASDVIGRVKPFADGSVAYDKNGDLAIWAKPNWTKIASGGGGGTKSYEMSETFGTALYALAGTLVTDILTNQKEEAEGTISAYEAADITAIVSMLFDMAENNIIPLLKIMGMYLTALSCTSDDGDGNTTISFYEPLFSMNAGGGPVYQFAITIQHVYNFPQETAHTLLHLRKLDN
jgi:hypothetical protein